MITIPPYIGIQADELRAEFSALELFGKPEGPWKIIGPLTFKAKYNDRCVEGTLPILIEIPIGYPIIIPTVKAYHTKLLDNYPHVNIDDNTFCLGVPFRLKMLFSENPTLLFFVK